MKECQKCHQLKPLDQFWKSPRNTGGKSTWCIDCYKAWSKGYEARPEVKAKRRIARSKYVSKRPEEEKDRQFKKKYGISLKQKEALLEKQGWVCAITGCGATLNMRTGQLDHCHATKEIRGVLCRACNQGLGHFKDSPARLAGAIDYLIRRG